MDYVVQILAVLRHCEINVQLVGDYEKSFHPTLQVRSIVTGGMTTKFGRIDNELGVGVIHYEYYTMLGRCRLSKGILVHIVNSEVIYYCGIYLYKHWVRWRYYWIRTDRRTVSRGYVSNNATHWSLLWFKTWRFLQRMEWKRRSPRYRNLDYLVQGCSRRWWKGDISGCL